MKFYKTTTTKVVLICHMRPKIDRHEAKGGKKVLPYLIGFFIYYGAFYGIWIIQNQVTGISKFSAHHIKQIYEEGRGYLEITRTLTNKIVYVLVLLWVSFPQFYGCKVLCWGYNNITLEKGESILRGASPLRQHSLKDKSDLGPVGNPKVYTLGQVVEK